MSIENPSTMREEVDGEHGLLTGEKTTTGREGFLKEKTTPASPATCRAGVD
jgi:hypothetical protein